MKELEVYWDNVIQFLSDMWASNSIIITLGIIGSLITILNYFYPESGTKIRKNLRRLFFKEKTKYFVGIDMGRSRFDLVLLEYDVRNKTQKTISEKSYDNQNSYIDYNKSFYKTIINEIRDLLEQVKTSANIKLEVLSGIGFSVPGIVSPSNGKILKSVGFSKTVFHFVDGFRNQLEKTYNKSTADEFKIYIDNDAFCLARYVQFTQLQNNKLDSFICFDIGNNFGAAFSIDGKIYYGDNHMAGEAGHMVISTDESDSCKCKVGSGHVEQYISSDGLLKKIKNAYPEHPILEAKNKDTIYSMFRNKISDGDEKLESILDDLTNELAITISNLVNILDIGLVYCGGSMMRELYYNGKLKNKFAKLHQCIEGMTFIDNSKISLCKIDDLHTKSIDGAGISSTATAVATGAALLFIDENYKRIYDPEV